MKPLAFLARLALMILGIGSASLAQEAPAGAGTSEAAPAVNPAPIPAANPMGQEPAEATNETRKPRAPRNPQTTSLDALFKMVPEGRTQEDPRYPIMENGQITAFIQSQRMTRLDENSLQFENAVINQKGETPMIMRLERAVYNRTTGQLMSNQHSVIENKDYVIEGDSMNYDRKTTLSRMTNIRMTIFNMDGLSAEAPAKPGAEEREKKDQGDSAKTILESDKREAAPSPVKEVGLDSQKAAGAEKK